MQMLQIGTIVRPLTLTAEVTIGLRAFSGHVGVLKRVRDNVAESGQHVKSHPNDASVGEKKVISPERVPSFKQNGPLKLDNQVDA